MQKKQNKKKIVLFFCILATEFMKKNIMCELKPATSIKFFNHCDSIYKDAGRFRKHEKN
ncbi:MAG TPA: hypothetical protein PLS49_01480 [Candidatus Woesebacteria bacterium]|nr:hypothetical protein [Candidatus Woesebacteria bacterium]